MEKMDRVPSFEDEVNSDNWGWGVWQEVKGRKGKRGRGRNVRAPKEGETEEDAEGPPKPSTVQSRGTQENSCQVKEQQPLREICSANYRLTGRGLLQRMFGTGGEWLVFAERTFISVVHKDSRPSGSLTHCQSAPGDLGGCPWRAIEASDQCLAPPPPPMRRPHPCWLQGATSKEATGSTDHRRPAASGERQARSAKEETASKQSEKEELSHGPTRRKTPAVSETLSSLWFLRRFLRVWLSAAVAGLLADCSADDNSAVQASAAGQAGSKKKGSKAKSKAAPNNERNECVESFIKRMEKLLLARVFTCLRSSKDDLPNGMTGNKTSNNKAAKKAGQADVCNAAQTSPEIAAPDTLTSRNRTKRKGQKTPAANADAANSSSQEEQSQANSAAEIHAKTKVLAKAVRGWCLAVKGAGKIKKKKRNGKGCGAAVTPANVTGDPEDTQHAKPRSRSPQCRPVVLRKFVVAWRGSVPAATSPSPQEAEEATEDKPGTSAGRLLRRARRKARLREAASRQSEAPASENKKSETPLNEDGLRPWTHDGAALLSHLLLGQGNRLRSSMKLSPLSCLPYPPLFPDRDLLRAPPGVLTPGVLSALRDVVPKNHKPSPCDHEESPADDPQKIPVAPSACNEPSLAEVAEVAEVSPQADEVPQESQGNPTETSAQECSESPGSKETDGQQQDSSTTVESLDAEFLDAESLDAHIRGPMLLKEKLKQIRSQVRTEDGVAAKPTFHRGSKESAANARAAGQAAVALGGNVAATISPKQHIFSRPSTALSQASLPLKVSVHDVDHHARMLLRAEMKKVSGRPDTLDHGFGHPSTIGGIWPSSSSSLVSFAKRQSADIIAAAHARNGAAFGSRAKSGEASGSSAQNSEERARAAGRLLGRSGPKIFAPSFVGMGPFTGDPAQVEALEKAWEDGPNGKDSKAEPGSVGSKQNESRTSPSRSGGQTSQTASSGADGTKTGAAGTASTVRPRRAARLGENPLKRGARLGTGQSGVVPAATTGKGERTPTAGKTSATEGSAAREGVNPDHARMCLAAQMQRAAIHAAAGRCGFNLGPASLVPPSSLSLWRGPGRQHPLRPGGIGAGVGGLQAQDSAARRKTS